MSALDGAVLDRMTTRTANGCWEWTGAIDKGTGYGRCNRETYGEQWAHRATYVAMVGPIPDGLVIDHLCRNRRCVNPEHLEPVTTAENARRSPLMGVTYRRRSLATTCVHGHPRTPENLYVDKRGFTSCLTCRRIRWRRR